MGIALNGTLTPKLVPKLNSFIQQASTNLMEMPSGLSIADQKLTDYLLVYQDKSDKSQYLAAAGYTGQTWQLLKQDILRAVEGAKAEVISTDWGDRFKVK